MLIVTLSCRCRRGNKRGSLSSLIDGGYGDRKSSGVERSVANAVLGLGVHEAKLGATTVADLSVHQRNAGNPLPVVVQSGMIDQHFAGERSRNMGRVEQWAKEQHKMQEYYGSLDESDKRVTVRLTGPEYSLLCAIAAKVGSNPTATSYELLKQALWDAWEAMGFTVDEFHQQLQNDIKARKPVGATEK